jgi:hypothetical protein
MSFSSRNTVKNGYRKSFLILQRWVGESNPDGGQGLPAPQDFFERVLDRPGASEQNALLLGQLLKAVQQRF